MTGENGATLCANKVEAFIYDRKGRDGLGRPLINVSNGLTLANDLPPFVRPSVRTTDESKSNVEENQFSTRMVLFAKYQFVESFKFIDLTYLVADAYARSHCVHLSLCEDPAIFDTARTIRAFLFIPTLFVVRFAIREYTSRGKFSLTLETHASRMYQEIDKSAVFEEECCYRRCFTPLSFSL